jgi:hypothetical protein
MQSGGSDLGNLPRAANGIRLRHHGRRDHDHQCEGEDAAPADHCATDDVREEEYRGHKCG